MCSWSSHHSEEESEQFLKERLVTGLMKPLLHFDDSISVSLTKDPQWPAARTHGGPQRGRAVARSEDPMGFAEALP